MVLRFNVDFNELLEHNLVMLSQTDQRKDVSGVPVLLVEGLPIELQEDNAYADGSRQVLFARGIVEVNSTEQWPHVKWLCRIDADGVSDIAGK